MDKQKRKELKAKAGTSKTYMGVYQIKNEQSGKIYIAVSKNLKNQWLRQKMQLDDNSHMNKALQADWDTFGETAFTFEVLEKHEVKADMDVKFELQKLDKQWRTKLQPYGDKGYLKEKP